MKIYKSVSLLSLMLLSLGSCSVDMYTSDFKEQKERTVDVTVENEFDGSNPSFVSASKGAYTDRIALAWKSVAGADYYVIERAVDGSDDYVELPESVSGTSYEDRIDLSNPLVAGVRYRYRVYARSNSKSSTFGSQVTASAVGSILAAPGSVSASNEYSGYVMVEWEPVADATGYKIYKQDKENDVSYELVGTVSGSQIRYRYDAPESEDGDTLHFKVCAVGSNQMVTSLDDSRDALGNTLVPGAPSKPTSLVADQGARISYSASSNPIMLSWDKADDNTTGYLIYRSIPGEDEKQVYPVKQGDPNLNMEGTDLVTFKDTTGRGVVVPGKRITYTVIPLGEKDGESVKGSPSKVDAYLLSNPTEVNLSLQKSPAAYVVSFPQVVGLDTAEDRQAHASWTYELYMESVSGLTDQVTLHPTDYEDTVSKVVLYDKSEKADDQFTIFSLQVKNGDVETTETSQVTITRPGVAENFSVSQNRHEEGMEATKGIYPVRLSWKKNSNIDHYVLKRTSEDGSQDLGSVTIEGSATGYDDVYAKAEVGVKYGYSLKAYDVLDREGEDSERVTGYGALTGDKFIEVWSTYAFKPFMFVDSLPTSVDTDYQAGFNLQNYWRNAEIGKKVEKGNSSSLSTQMDALTGGSYIYNYCHYGHGSHSGTPGNESSYGRMGYNAETEGIGGQIYFTFEDFGELSYMYTNGEYEMHVDASGTGSAKSGSGGFTVEGMYPAKIGLGNITVKSKAFSGQYSVRMKDGSGTQSVTAR